MGQDIKESDWKRFREVHTAALERYTAQALSEIQYHLTDKTKPAAERFWEIVEATQNRKKELRGIFDDFRRSTAQLQLAYMRRLKLVTDEEMARFSPELREWIERVLNMKD